MGLRQKVKLIPDFKSSIQPLLNWLRVIGVDLEWQSSYHRRYTGIALGIISFLLNATCFIWLFADVSKYVGDISTTYGGANSSTYSFHIIYDYINVAVPSIGVHLSLLFISVSKWSNLCRAIYLVECNSKINLAKYKQVKLLAAVGVVYAFVVKGYLIAVQLFHDFTMSNIPTAGILLNSATIVAQIYPISGLVLSCTVCWMILLHFQDIRQDIDQTCDELSLSSKTGQLSHQIRKWNRHHYLLCDAVDSFNKCFGHIFLFNVTFIFTGAVSTSFFIYMSINEHHVVFLKILVASFLVEHVLNLIIITYVTDCLKNQTPQIVKSLRRLQLSVPTPHDYKVNLLMTEIIQAAPSVQGLGFFKVNQKLFPTLIGNALTYVIILCQFRASERQTVV